MLNLIDIFCVLYPNGAIVSWFFIRNTIALLGLWLSVKLRTCHWCTEDPKIFETETLIILVGKTYTKDKKLFLASLTCGSCENACNSLVSAINFFGKNAPSQKIDKMKINALSFQSVVAHSCAQK